MPFNNPPDQSPLEGTWNGWKYSINKEDDMSGGSMNSPLPNPPYLNASPVSRLPDPSFFPLLDLPTLSQSPLLTQDSFNTSLLLSSDSSRNPSPLTAHSTLTGTPESTDDLWAGLDPDLLLLDLDVATTTLEQTGSVSWPANDLAFQAASLASMAMADPVLLPTVPAPPAGDDSFVAQAFPPLDTLQGSDVPPAVTPGDSPFSIMDVPLQAHGNVSSPSQWVLNEGEACSPLQMPLPMLSEAPSQAPSPAGRSSAAPSPGSPSAASRPYTCSVCPKTYATRSQLQKHERRHKKPFACPVCKSTFGANKERQRHMCSAHPSEAKPEDLQKQYGMCHFCGRYGRLDNIKRHMRTIHHWSADDNQE